MKKIHFKHSIVLSGSYDDVEAEINEYNKNSRILDINVTPENIQKPGDEIPSYIYHICITYQDRD